MTRMARFVVALLFLVTGGTLTIAFMLDITLTIGCALTLMLLTAIVIMWLCAVTPLAILPRLLVLLYILPFGVCVGYLNDPNHRWPLFATDLSLNYQMDPLLIRQMLTVGVIGIMGLAAGTLLGGALLRVPKAREERLPAAPAPTLGPILFMLGIVVAVLLSWLNAPKENILQASPVTQTAAAAPQVNFNGAWLASYLILIMLWIDAERDTWSGRRARWKFLLILAASAYIVIFLELFRGDREAVSLVAALSGLYLTRKGRTGNRVWGIQWKRVLRLAVPAAALVVLFVMVGAARQQIAGSLKWMRPTAGDMLKMGLESSTWTGVLYTDLSLSGRYRFSHLTYLYGRTYVDYFLSLPPGVVARVIGYRRPMDIQQPAEWFYDVAGGGTYVTNVPFMNFGAPGVLFILALWGLLGAIWEVRGQDARIWPRLAYATALAISFFWFWYGEMNLIRGFSGAAGIYVAYRLATDVRAKIQKKLMFPYAHRH
jgi:hypothetical protein